MSSEGKISEFDFLGMTRNSHPRKHCTRSIGNLDPKRTEKSRPCERKIKSGEGSIETCGLSISLAKKLLKGVSVPHEMILDEIKKNEELRLLIFQLK